MARLNGWLCFHPFDSRRSESGWPDLVFVRADRIVYAELKSQRGRIRPEQVVWLDALARAGAEVHLWRPPDWQWIEVALSRRATTDHLPTRWPLDAAR